MWFQIKSECNQDPLTDLIYHNKSFLRHVSVQDWPSHISTRLVNDYTIKGASTLNERINVLLKSAFFSCSLLQLLLYITNKEGIRYRDRGRGTMA